MLAFISLFCVFKLPYDLFVFFFSFQIIEFQFYCQAELRISEVQNMGKGADLKSTAICNHKISFEDVHCSKSPGKSFWIFKYYSDGLKNVLKC